MRMDDNQSLYWTDTVHSKMTLSSIVLVLFLAASLLPSSHAIAYKYFGDNSTYFQARDNCRYKGWELARVDKQFQNDLIHFVSRSRVWLDGNILHEMPIGRHQKPPSTWMWHGKGLIKHKFWGPNQPDNWKDQEYCISMDEDGQWNDLNCAWRIGYVCQGDE